MTIIKVLSIWRSHDNCIKTGTESYLIRTKCRWTINEVIAKETAFTLHFMRKYMLTNVHIGILFLFYENSETSPNTSNQTTHGKQ